MRSRERTLTLVVGALSAGAALTGLVRPELYRDPEPIRSGFIANDAVTLFVAVPVLLLSRQRALSGSLAARLVLLGALHYTLYNTCFYLFGAVLNALLPLYAAIVSTSIWAIVLVAKDTVRLPVSSAFRDPPVRRVAAWMTFVSLGLTLTWLGQWAFALLRDAPPARFDLTPEFIRVTAGLDLTLIVGWFLPAAVLLWQRRPWGFIGGTAANVSGALYNVVLAAGTALHIRAGLAGAWALFALWVGLLAGSTWCAVRMLQSMRSLAEPSEPLSE